MVEPTRKIYMKPREFPFGVRRVPLNADFEAHTHDCTELMLIASGTAMHTVDGQDYMIRAGDVCVLNTGTVHELRHVSNLEQWLLAYYPEMLGSLGAEIRKIPGFHPLFVTGPAVGRQMGFQCKLQLDLQTLREAVGLLTKMREEFEAEREGYEAVVRACFVQFVAFLSRRYSDADTEAPRWLFQLAKVASYLEEHACDELSLSKLADVSGLSVRHLTRLFKTHYNASPIQYLLALRVQNAATLLRQTDKRITELAFDCGFADSNYFARQFRHIMGVSPSEYRRKG
ncbi:MAG: helix-turn-helix domain-containing protein [Kiritimatiellae bacterium]|nr:helix-turn-helix domain-containing protein [Kiritimatiellia bacterium]